jgi:hypothetical protein
VSGPVERFFLWLEAHRAAAFALGGALVLAGIALWFLAHGVVRWLGLVLLFLGMMLAPRFGESRNK